LEQIIKQLVSELRLNNKQIETTIQLIDEGNTIPFIARYRKEMTGNLSDVQLRELNDRLTYLRNLAGRKEEVIRLIEEQGKLTDELKLNITKAKILTEVEDLYRPYKQKRRTKATIAKEKGLEPLATRMMFQQDTTGSVDAIASEYINPENEVNTVEEVLQGAMDIIAEWVSDNADYRKWIRMTTFNRGIVQSVKVNDEEESTYEMYYEYSEAVKSIPSHRILAINRGEKEKVLRVKLEAPAEDLKARLKREVILKPNTLFNSYIEDAIDDSYKRLIAPSIEREIRNELTENAEEKAIQVFGINLKNLLMLAPIKGKVVMGFDPAYRTGSKIIVLDPLGKVLDQTTVYPVPPQNDKAKAVKILTEMILKHKVDIVAIGNGTASRESEQIVAEMLRDVDRDVYYTIVNEAGASVYSASKLATEEYPDINVSIRGAISIAGRLQDPLAELVKIDPKSIGVGQYQHDVNQKRLEDVLGGVVEDAVNSVGVDVNTASASLLQYVSGISKVVSKNIIKYRETNGIFKTRKEILKVARFGPAAFTQAAGFLRIADGKQILDATGVHPESYDVAIALLGKLGYDLDDVSNQALEGIEEKAKLLSYEKLAETLGAGVLTLEDIVKELLKPGRDPREDMPKPVFRSDVLSIEDIKEEMVLTGTVRNVIDFGAFVDIGIKNDGLVHISQLSDKFVKNPMSVVSVGDVVDVRVIGVDLKRGRVSLSMKGIKK